MPRPFGPLVQNALVAEPRSVKIGALVGENGRWYAFGKMIVDLYVRNLISSCHLSSVKPLTFILSPLPFRSLKPSSNSA